MIGAADVRLVEVPGRSERADAASGASGARLCRRACGDDRSLYGAARWAADRADGPDSRIEDPVSDLTAQLRAPVAPYRAVTVAHLTSRPDSDGQPAIVAPPPLHSTARPAPRRSAPQGSITPRTYGS